MNNTLRIILYVVLTAGAVVFGCCFYANYSHYMKDNIATDIPARMREAATGLDTPAESKTEVNPETPENPAETTFTPKPETPETRSATNALSTATNAAVTAASKKGVKTKRVRPVVDSTPEPGSGRIARIFYFGGLFFITVLGLGFLVGHDFSLIFGDRFGKFLFNDEGESIKKSAYEEAEEIWANGNPLEAVQLMRNYLQKNPREQHVALRIAEIYEKDLQNPLAAALEYEELLKQKLNPEQWGWTAIHLCNIYLSKMRQPDKAVALLRRIVDEYGETSAAEKARKRLEMHEAEAEAEAQSNEEASAPERPKAETLAPKPKIVPPNNTALQAHFDRFHQAQNPTNDHSA